MNNIEIPDVDLDVKNRDAVLRLFPKAITASQIDNKGNLTLHKTGMYFQRVPTDPLTGLSVFPYDIAEQLGYFKVDMIPYHVYDMVRDHEHLDELMRIAESDYFPWHWFLDVRFYQNEDPNLQLTQLSRHYYLVEMYPPKSVEDLAVLNALIRPRKMYLTAQPWEVVKGVVWEKIDGEEGYFFKKSHAIAFALVILIHMQLIAEKLEIGPDDEIQLPED